MFHAEIHTSISCNILNVMLLCEVIWDIHIVLARICLNKEVVRWKRWHLRIEDNCGQYREGGHIVKHIFYRLGQCNLISWMTNPSEQNLGPNIHHPEKNMAIFASCNSKWHHFSPIFPLIFHFICSCQWFSIMYMLKNKCVMSRKRP